MFPTLHVTPQLTWGQQRPEYNRWVHSYANAKTRPHTHVHTHTRAGLGHLLALPHTVPVVEVGMRFVVAQLSVLLLYEDVCRRGSPQLQTLRRCQDTVTWQHTHTHTSALHTRPHSLLTHTHTLMHTYTHTHPDAHTTQCNTQASD